MSPAEQLQRLLVDADEPKAPAPDEALRFSRLKRIGQSPAHYAYGYGPETAEMETGTGTHSILLVARDMLLHETPVLAYPGKVRRGKEFDAFVAANPGAIILTRREFTSAKGMAEAVRACPDAMRVLDGEREQTFTWKLQGRLCRGTPDVRSDKFITELKTGETSDPRFFPFKLRRFCYHGQLAWYSDGAVLAGLPDPKEHYVVAVEAAAPYVVTVFRIAPATIEKGRRLARLWFERLLQCEAAQEWPGYSQSVVELALPDYGFDDGDEGGTDVLGSPEDAIT